MSSITSVFTSEARQASPSSSVLSVRYIVRNPVLSHFSWSAFSCATPASKLLFRAHESPLLHSDQALCASMSLSFPRSLFPLVNIIIRYIGAASLPGAERQPSRPTSPSWRKTRSLLSLAGRTGRACLCEGLSSPGCLEPRFLLRDFPALLSLFSVEAAWVFLKRPSSSSSSAFISEAN